ncbi:AAA family ATPase [Fusibacter sp. 3D3]|uniref:AAA family ATPase n=1 Tax=Fusibacter sp. 3D3 TaxID=1048380 RepID=UPI000853C725|nr:AAA family ATPase [Fusibacter sp. 3D3]GAU76436.1 predicted ATPase [Fusibacter sp. 3D3]
MIYLEKFILPSKDREFNFFIEIKRQCYNTFYPFQVFAYPEDLQLDFEPITILYGGNGSGKTTALNVIAEKLGLKRESVFNQSNFFEAYLKYCDHRIEAHIPEHSAIITSDDVFDYALNIRNLNLGIDQKRTDMFEGYLEAKYSDFKMNSLEDYERLKMVNQTRSKTQSRYIRENLISNIRSRSNGENAFKYFTEKITEKGLFLLDEPENSLSPKMQLKLKSFIEEAVRYFGCQIIMSTHSPFLLSIEGAKIYDFDSDPVEIKNWLELEHIKKYYELFKDIEI